MSVGEHDRRLAAIRERAEKATEGPWLHVGAVVCKAFGEEEEVAYLAEAETGNDEADGDFIAHAREDVPWVLAELAVVREERDRLREALEDARKRLWWFIEQDGGDGNEIEAAEVAARAMEIQHDVIDAALSVPVPDGSAETAAETE